MMRIKESIQRRKIIQELNDEYYATQHQTQIDEKLRLQAAARKSPQRQLPKIPTTITKTPSSSSMISNGLSTMTSPSSSASDTTTNTATNSSLLSQSVDQFIAELSARLTDLQKRALRVTWKRLSEAPKTSGRGTIHIMERVFQRLADNQPHTMGIFYKCAFVSCVRDKAEARRRLPASSLMPNSARGSIATLRDHAHLLVDFVNAIISKLFNMPHDAFPDPALIGQAHVVLEPLGFDRRLWQEFGECFAEVMFTQDCIRAYPHAARAWSVLIVAITDRMFAFYEQQRIARKAHDQLIAAASSSDRPKTMYVDADASVVNGCPAAAAVGVHRDSNASNRQLELETMRGRSRYIKIPIIITDTDRFVGQRTSSTGSL